MSDTSDVIIIGGGIIGCATGYYLTKRGLKVNLLEKDYLTAGSSGRCIGGIRQQFSTELSIKVAMESMKKFAAMKEELGQEVEFHQGGCGENNCTKGSESYEKGRTILMEKLR